LHLHAGATLKVKKGLFKRRSKN